MKIYANVKPGAREEKIERISDKEFNIWVKERPEDNKANTKVLNLLARVLGVSAMDMIIKNPKSRRKIIEVEDE